MQILPVNNYLSQNKNQNPNFKSVIATAIWVREGSTGSYAPVLSKEISKSLMTKIVSRLTTPKYQIAKELQSLVTQKESLLKGIGVLKSKIAALQDFVEENRDSDCSQEKVALFDLQKEKRVKERKIKEIDIKLAKLDITQRVKRFIASRDKSYAKYPFARSFNIDGGFVDNKFKNISFLLTGNDAAYFDENFGRPIGITKAKYKGPIQSAEERQAKHDYWTKGQDFVVSRAKEFKKDDEQMELHVKMQTRRAKNGTIQGYDIVNMELFPKRGPKNPFVMTDWIHK